MHKRLLYFGLFLLGAMILSCLVTLMIAFTGGSFAGADLSGLLLLQIAAIPASLLVVAMEIAAFVRTNGWRNGLAMLWDRIPAWLVLAIVLLNSLVLIGELSVLLLRHLMDEPISLIEQVPLLALLSGSAAFALLYAKAARMYGSGTVRVGRWP